MNLKSQLQALKKDKTPSPFIKDITKTLKILASNGRTSTTVASSKYDQETIEYLRNEGLSVEVVSDFRDGDYIKIAW